MSSRSRHTSVSANTYPYHDTMFPEIGYEYPSSSQAVIGPCSNSYPPSPPSSASPSPPQHKSHPRYLPRPWDTPAIPPQDEYRESISFSSYSYSSADTRGLYDHGKYDHGSPSGASDALFPRNTHDAHAPSNIYNDKRSHYYEDFVLYPSSSSSYDWKNQDSEKQDSRYTESSRSKSNRGRGESWAEKEHFREGSLRLASGNPPMAPRLPRLATPEIRGSEELYGDWGAVGSVGHMGYVYGNHSAYDVHAGGEGQVGWLPPAKEGMFPDL